MYVSSMEYEKDSFRPIYDLIWANFITTEPCSPEPWEFLGEDSGNLFQRALIQVSEILTFTEEQGLAAQEDRDRDQHGVHRRNQQPRPERPPSSGPKEPPGPPDRPKETSSVVWLRSVKCELGHWALW